MNPYEGLATVERSDGTLVRVWAEVTVAQEHSAADPDRPWTARLTAPGGEGLLLRGAVSLILDSGTRWPAEVTYTQLSSGLHSPSWTEIRGTGPAVTVPGVTGPGERRGTVLRPEPDPDHDGTP
ncbi:hypothetical protein [Streptomyces sp. NPDC056227]|uniref:hypothetical protein n=1 Tax=Streptomyces sp. NPDC056227 TaxID=3345753 RepID=UPI0035D6D486